MTEKRKAGGARGDTYRINLNKSLSKRAQAKAQERERQMLEKTSLKDLIK
jgi:hypothetical protein